MRDRRAARRAPGPTADRLRYKVLAVDDEPDSLLVVKQRLETDGFSVLTAKSAEEAFAAAVESRPDLVLSDVSMPGEGGLADLGRAGAHG
jgi:CheY-like chemotaxis protein